MPDPQSLRRLAAMRIPVWVLRDRARHLAPGENAGPRVRLEAGDGDWLLVVGNAERSEYRTVLDDIRAAIGTARCRFGQWSDSPDSGVAAADWPAHGIEHVVAFDASGPRHDVVIAGVTLAELSTSGRARRKFWHRLAALLRS